MHGKPQLRRNANTTVKESDDYFVKDGQAMVSPPLTDNVWPVT
jgi:hypothetical protein